VGKGAVGWRMRVSAVAHFLGRRQSRENRPLGYGPRPEQPTGAGGPLSWVTASNHGSTQFRKAVQGSQGVKRERRRQGTGVSILRIQRSRTEPLKRKEETAKAAEDSRTPKRRRCRTRTRVPKVLECGCPLPLLGNRPLQPHQCRMNPDQRLQGEPPC
jgi:hypothetical protein